MNLLKNLIRETTQVLKDWSDEQTIGTKQLLNKITENRTKISLLNDSLDRRFDKIEKNIVTSLKRLSSFSECVKLVAKSLEESNHRIKSLECSNKRLNHRIKSLEDSNRRIRKTIDENSSYVNGRVDTVNDRLKRLENFAKEQINNR